MNVGVIIANKIATGDGTKIVCGNSDYIVNFTFDEEWAKYETKTMRVQYQNGKHEDVIFTGTRAALPVLVAQTVIHIGVFAGDLHTTTPAFFRCKPSILCKAGSPDKPREDVYAQLMERMAQLENSDWNQNDPTAKDYVKNRTHWVEMQYEEKYANNDAPFADSGYGSIWFTPDSVTWDLVAGDNYSVVFDGIEYRCVCNSASRYGRTWLWAGNANLGAPYNEFASNTGEPFLITDSMIIAKSAGNHAIQISRVDVNIHRLPEAFMDLDGVWDSIDIATEKANTAIAGTQLVVTQLKVGDINVGETYSSAVKVANGVSTLVGVSGPAYIIAAGNQSTVKQFIYLNKMLSGVAYTGMFAELNASEDGVGRVYGVYVNVKDAIAKFTRIA